ncbi:MAG: stress response translation initiation inhibitor YciH [Pseudomonadota bacterium]
MSRRKDSNSRLVYSTDKGQLDKVTEPSSANRRQKTSKPAFTDPNDGVVRLRRESKGRGGKAMTVITGLPGNDTAIAALAKLLKQRCGVGGAVKAGHIEIQGDKRDVIKPILEAQGYRVKIAGG